MAPFEAVFAALLRLYPDAFRRAYGAPMRADFGEQLRERAGAPARFRFALGAYVDVVRAALDERTADLRRDAGAALRAIRKAPGSASVIIGTLALAIGANVAVFTIVRAAVLAPLPFPDSERLVIVDGLKDGAPYGLSLPDFDDLRTGAHAFAAMAAAVSYDQNHVLDVGGSSRALSIEVVSPAYFEIFAIPPELGRAFTDADGRAGAAQTIVLSDRLWRRDLAADPAIVGKVLRIDDTPYRVIGVAAPALQPSGDLTQTDYDAWTALREGELGKSATRDAHYFDAIARLRPGVSLEAARAELEATFANLRIRYPQTDRRYGVGVRTLLDGVVGPMRPTLFAIFAAVAAVLAIASANVANLLLGRASVREREIVVRLALGAPRRRIAQAVFTETLVLVAAGGALGLGLAYLAVSSIVASHTALIPRLDDVRIDRWSIGAAAAIVVAVTLLAGLIPALSLSRRALSPVLASAGRSGDASRGSRARAALVVFEFAAALALVVIAGLVTRSYASLVNRPLGFEPANLAVTEGVQLWGKRYESADARRAYFAHALAQTRAVPGVVDAEWAFTAPFVPFAWNQGFAIVGAPIDPNGSPSARMDPVGPHYFSLLHIPLRAGRTFTEQDRSGTPDVLIVNEAFAHAFFSGRSPVGARVSIGSTDDRKAQHGIPTIVGVVADARNSFASVAPPTIYRPLAQNPAFVSTMLVRFAPGVAANAAVTNAIAATDSHLLPAEVTPIRVFLDRSSARARFTMSVLATLAGVALVLALAGIFAVVSYGVSQRTREFGIRMALGAQPGRIRGDVLVRAMRLAGAGIALGVIAAALLARSLALGLYDVAPLDPWTFTLVAGAMAAAALGAALLPAWRATRVDPVVALRVE